MDSLDAEKKIALMVDEWGTWWDEEPGTISGHLYQQNSLRDAMVAALMLNVFHKYTDRVRMCNIAQVVNVLQSMILTDQKGTGHMVLTPTYHVFEMYRPFQEATFLPITLKCDSIKTTEGKTMPLLSASAARTQQGNIVLALANTSLKDAQTPDIALQGTKAKGVSGRVLTCQAEESGAERETARQEYRRADHRIKSDEMITNTGVDNQKDVALVLSSGGARGLVHIGVIEELEEQGYHISSIAGASMGALIGGVYAAGKLTEFREWMKGIDKRKMVELTDFSLSINHLVKGNRIIDAIKEIVPDTPIENLPIPYCAVATDWETGREVTFRKGSLFGAIRASISLPAYYEPVRINGMVLIDGGIVNPLPLNRVARKKGDLLVGVDVSGHDYQGQNALQNFIEQRRKKDKSLSQLILNKLLPDNLDFNYYTLLSRTSSIMIRQNSKLMVQLTHPDMLIDIQLNKYGGFDYDKSEKLINFGHHYAQKAIEKLQNNLKNIG